MATIICAYNHPEWRESELWICELVERTSSNYCMAPNTSTPLNEDRLQLLYQWFIQQEEQTLGCLTQHDHPCVLLQPSASRTQAGCHVFILRWARVSQFWTGCWHVLTHAKGKLLCHWVFWDSKVAILSEISSDSFWKKVACLFEKSSDSIFRKVAFSKLWTFPKRTNSKLLNGMKIWFFCSVVNKMSFGPEVSTVLQQLI